MDNRAGVLFGEKWPPGSAGRWPASCSGSEVIVPWCEPHWPAAGAPGKRALVLASAGSSFTLSAVSDQTTTQIKQLLATPEPPALGPEPRAGVMTAAALNDKLDALFRATKLSPTQQELIRSLLLLWHDHLDASHNISQSIENADGSFVHALMHRREPDYWNAKYWWRRVGAHPAFGEISRCVGELLAGSRRREEADSGGMKPIRLVTSAATTKELATKLLPGGKWDACAFVDVCEAAAGTSENVELLREIQRIETEVLLESFLNR